MKAAFFHDSIFIKKNDEYYTSGTLNEDLFKYSVKYKTVLNDRRTFEKYLKDNNWVKNDTLFAKFS